MLLNNNDGPVLLATRSASQHHPHRKSDRSKAKDANRNSWSFQSPANSPLSLASEGAPPREPQPRYTSRRQDVWVPREVWEPTNNLSDSSLAALVAQPTSDTTRHQSSTSSSSTSSSAKPSLIGTQVRNRSRQRSPGPGTGSHKASQRGGEPPPPSLKSTPSSKGIDYIRSPSNLSVNAISATRRSLAFSRSCEASSGQAAVELTAYQSQHHAAGPASAPVWTHSQQQQPLSLLNLTPSQSILHDPFFQDYQEIQDLALVLPGDRNVYGNPDGASTASPASTTEREFPGTPGKQAPREEENEEEEERSNSKGTAMYPDVLRNTKLVDEHISERDRKPSSVGKSLNGGKGAAALGEEEVKPFNQVSAPEVFKDEESSLVCKGLLWVMRDRLFSRWRERYCLLTKDYLHCFKRNSGLSLTPMGAFLFKVNLADVTEAEWLEKKGQVAIALTLPREGKLLLKTSNGLSDWLAALKSCIQESKGRRHTLLGRKMEPEGQERAKQRLKSTLQHTQSAESVPDVSHPPRSQSQASHSQYGGNARPPSRYRFSMLAEIDVCNPSSVSKSRDNIGVVQKGGTKSKTSVGVGNGTRPHGLTPTTCSSYTQTPAGVGAGSERLLQNAGDTQPVRYRERSCSVDRTRMSRRSAEMNAQRRSYYLSPVTQV